MAPGQKGWVEANIRVGGCLNAYLGLAICTRIASPAIMSQSSNVVPVLAVPTPLPPDTYL